MSFAFSSRMILFKSLFVIFIFLPFTVRKIRSQRINDFLFPAKVIMQVAGADIDLVRDIVDGRARHAVFVEQQEAGNENPVSGVTSHDRPTLVENGDSDLNSRRQCHCYSVMSTTQSA